MHIELERLHNMLAAQNVRYDQAGGEFLNHDFDHARFVLDHAGYFGRSNQWGSRADANESAVLSRQLVYIKNVEANVVYPDIKIRSFVPVSNEIPAWAETYSIKTYDRVGKAGYVSNYSDDSPRADVFVSETLANIKPIRNSYGYNVAELRASAALGGLSLDARKASNAADVHARAQESIGALGDTLAGFTGFANNAGVTVVSAGITGGWSTASDAQILADVINLVQVIALATKQTTYPDTLALPTKAFTYITSKPAGANFNGTIAKWILANNPWIKTIDQYIYLDTAGSGGVPRAVMYKKDPSILQFEVPLEFTQHPVQQRGIEFVVECESRMGGVSLRYVKTMVYCDLL